MKLMHVSDTHGCFPDLPGEFDAVVYSGDFFPFNYRESHEGRALELYPNRNSETRQAEIEFQKTWMLRRIDTLKDQVKGKPIVWSSGNHDFFNPCDMLNEHGVRAVNIDNKVMEYMGLVWYGFPYVPMLRNAWNFERDDKELKHEVQTFVQRLKEDGKLDKLDVLVAHCPPDGVLDFANKKRIGNKHMHSALFYQLQKPPQLYLCGHAHPSNGLDKMGDIVVSNAAIGDDGKPRLVEVTCAKD